MIYRNVSCTAADNDADDGRDHDRHGCSAYGAPARWAIWTVSTATIRRQVAVVDFLVGYHDEKYCCRGGRYGSSHHVGGRNSYQRPPPPPPGPTAPTPSASVPVGAAVAKEGSSSESNANAPTSTGSLNSSVGAAAGAGRGEGSFRGRGGRFGGRGRGMVGRTSIQYRYDPNAATAPTTPTTPSEPVKPNEAPVPATAVSDEGERHSVTAQAATGGAGRGRGSGPPTGGYFRGSGGRGRSSGRATNKTWVREPTADTPLVHGR